MILKTRHKRQDLRAVKRFQEVRKQEDIYRPQSLCHFKLSLTTIHYRTLFSLQDWNKTELCPRTSADFLLNRLLQDLDATRTACVDLLSHEREQQTIWSSPSLSLASGLTMRYAKLAIPVDLFSF